MEACHMGCLGPRRSPRLEQCRLGCSVRLVSCVCADGCCMRVVSGLCVQECVYGTCLGIFLVSVRDC